MPDPWQALRRDFAVSLKAENKSHNTQRLYLGAVDLGCSHLPKLGVSAVESAQQGEQTGIQRSVAGLDRWSMI
jgi:hypothetical protein